MVNLYLIVSFLISYHPRDSTNKQDCINYILLPLIRLFDCYALLELDAVSEHELQTLKLNLQPYWKFVSLNNCGNSLLQEAWSCCVICFFQGWKAGYWFWIPVLLLVSTLYGQACRTALMLLPRLLASVLRGKSSLSSWDLLSSGFFCCLLLGLQ